MTAGNDIVGRLMSQVGDDVTVILDRDALLTEAAQIIRSYRRTLSAMQDGTFYAQDADGCLRRWHPPHWEDAEAAK